MHKPRNGLTLVELLVVIAIVGLVLSLAIPAALRARKSARNTQCLNNLRQIVLGIKIYADYHQDRFPDEIETDWFTEIASYLETQDNVFYCPSNPEAEDIGYEWRENKALLPSAHIARKKLTNLSTKEIIVVFDQADSWHSPDMLNAAVLNGAARAFTVEEFEENMLLNVTTGTITLN